MKANELRIGNWVADAAGNYNRIAVISMPNQIETYSKDVDWLAACIVDDVLPIPLTPEILEKAGFVKSINFDNTYIKLIKGESFILKDCKDGTFFVYTGIRCQYLHQLQNLYFALTGEELNIEL
jgi:hypothetical protein